MTAITAVFRKREKSRRPSTFLSQQSSPVQNQSGSPQHSSPLLDRSRRQSGHLSTGSPSVITPAENAEGDSVLQV